MTAERKKANAEDPDAPEAFDPGADASKDAEKAKLAVRLVGEPTVGMGFTAQVVKLASGDPHWREQFAPSNTPSPEVARKAREKFGWLLEGNGRG